MRDIEEAVWTVAGLDPEEKLVLLALARNARRTPFGLVAVVGTRALRGMACAMTPAELDMVLSSLERQGRVTRLEDGPAGRRAAVLEREHAQDGPWKAWRLDLDVEEVSER